MGLTVRSQRVKMDRGLTLSTCAVRAESEGMDSGVQEAVLGSTPLFRYTSQEPKAKAVDFWLMELKSARTALLQARLDLGAPMMPSNLVFLVFSLFLLPPLPLPLSFLLFLSLPPFGSTFLSVDFAPHKPTLSSAGSPQPPSYLLSILKERDCFFPAGFRSSTP